MPPECEKIQRMSGILLRRAAEHQVRDGARAVGRVFDRAGRNAGHGVVAAVRRQRMHVDHCLAAVELLVDRRERGIAEILAVIAREHSQAVALQRVEGVFDFLEAALDVERRDGREQAEAARMLLHELRAVFVDGAAQRARLRRVAIPGAGLDLRQHGGRDSALVHLFERHLRRPFRCALLVLGRAPRDAPAAGSGDGRRSGFWRPAPSRPVRRWSRRRLQGPARQARRRGNCGGRGELPARAGAGSQQTQLAKNLRFDDPPSLVLVIPSSPMRLVARARSSVGLAWRIRILGQGGWLCFSPASAGE